MADIMRPQIIDISTGKVTERLDVYDASLTLCTDASSSANIRIDEGRSIDSLTYIRMYTIQGFAGIFRTRAPVRGIGGQTSQLQMEHAVNALGDVLVKETIEKEMTVKAALDKIFSAYKSTLTSAGKTVLWKLGSLDHSSDKIVLDVDYTNCLEAIDGIVEQIPELMYTYDFSSIPWKLNIVNRDTKVSAEGRLSRNMKGVQVTKDDAELATRVYIKGLGGKDKWGSVESAYFIGEYGVVEKTIDGANSTKDIARATAMSYLRRHQKPRYTIAIDGVELSNLTGETLDKFTVGKLMRIVMLDYRSQPIEENITQISFPSIYGQPNAVTVTLSDEDDTIVKQIKKEQKRTSGGMRSISKKVEETGDALADALWTAEVSNNTLTIKSKDGKKVTTFKKAVTHKAGWSSGTYKVESVMNSITVKTSSTKLKKILSNGDNYTTDGKTLKVPLKVMYDNGSTDGADTGFHQTINTDGKPCYNKGRNDTEIKEPNWNSGATGSTNNATFRTNAPTPQTRKLYVKLTQTSNTVYLAASNTGSTWVNYAKLDVTNSWTLPSSPSTSSSEPSGSFDRYWAVSKGYSWIYFTVTCNGESKKFKIHLTT